jgi:lipopolysaccharide transport system ATP-binding protein
MPPIIEIQKLGKRYSVKEVQPYLALRDVVSEKIKNVFSKRKNPANEFWALQNINLTIEKGERVGIIGRNGAGKSTLLKILSKITPPTTGEIKLRGRVASLLEVGTGFHPELTGRENIYLNGSILGLTKKEINQKLDEIIDFSGVENFIDTPLKHYSSGMQLRLAFSVAAHLEPEILLIDEVLAVGDMEFQKKCIGKMEEVSKNDGRTILFVSHDLSAISSLTNKCVFLDHGQIHSLGSTQDVIGQYTSFQKKSTTFQQEAAKEQPTVTKVELITSEGSTVQAHGKPLSIVFDIYMPEDDVANMNLSIQIFNQLGKPVIYNWLFDYNQTFCRKKGVNTVEISYPKLRLYKGSYFVRVHLAETKTKRKFQQFDCCYFDVEMLNMTEPDWGWQTEVCQYLEEGNWIIKDNE